MRLVLVAVLGAIAACASSDRPFTSKAGVASTSVPSPREVTPLAPGSRNARIAIDELLWTDIAVSGPEPQSQRVCELIVEDQLQIRRQIAEARRNRPEKAAARVVQPCGPDPLAPVRITASGVILRLTDTEQGLVLLLFRGEQLQGDWQTNPVIGTIVEHSVLPRERCIQIRDQIVREDAALVIERNAEVRQVVERELEQARTDVPSYCVQPDKRRSECAKDRAEVEREVCVDLLERHCETFQRRLSSLERQARQSAAA
ncbi:MAG: hypothetical protein AB7O24_19250 [Kofleriaceae bacterium]